MWCVACSSIKELIEMLNREQVLEVAELFLGGKPEEAYKKVSSMSEWAQFTGSIKKKDIG